MCMLCVVPPHVVPDRDKLMASAINNPHGFGFAIVIPKERRILVEKSMNPDESINRFLEMRGKYPEGHALWHARYATHGSTTLANCHPFQVDDKAQTFLAHNGILSVLEDKTDRSDTRIFAEDILAKLGGVTALDNDQIYNMIEEFSSGSKLCVLTVDPAAKYECYMFHQDKGKYDDSGTWWSNDSCDWNYGRYESTKSYVWYDDEQYAVGGTQTKTECPNCFALLDEYEVEFGYCEFCQCCIDCKSSVNECLCYSTPMYKHNKDRWFLDKEPEPVQNKLEVEAWKGQEW